MASDLTSSLLTYFGFGSFRPGQEEAIQSLIKGNHTLIVMPTGADKSLEAWLKDKASNLPVRPEQPNLF
jgi:superfamily II DNA helicase RecQ